jgi:hypothetical protein
MASLHAIEVQVGEKEGHQPRPSATGRNIRTSVTTPANLRMDSKHSYPYAVTQPLEVGNLGSAGHV